MITRIRKGENIPRYNMFETKPVPDRIQYRIAKPGEKIPGFAWFHLPKPDPNAPEIEEPTE
jgi:hypothetical protein